LRELEHPNIVRLINSDPEAAILDENGNEIKRTFYMALELCSGGEIFDFVAQTGKFDQ